ncbi:MAG: hypothetical protein ACYTE8_07455 [Planctomycetota bacterium]
MPAKAHLREYQARLAELAIAHFRIVVQNLRSILGLGFINQGATDGPGCDKAGIANKITS